jgi:hypothetical protein
MKKELKYMIGGFKTWIYDKNNRFYMTQGKGFTFRISEKTYKTYLKDIIE